MVHATRGLIFVCLAALAATLAGCASDGSAGFTSAQWAAVAGAIVAEAPAASKVLCNQLSKTPKSCKALAGVGVATATGAVDAATGKPAVAP